MSEKEYKNFNHYLWYKESEGIITIGINDDGVEEITEITSLDLPAEHEEVDSDEAIGVLETSDGEIEIFSPVKGTVIEVNADVVDNPDLILEDSYEDGWLLRIESQEEMDTDEDEDDEEDEDDDHDEDDEDFEEDED